MVGVCCIERPARVRQEVTDLEGGKYGREVNSLGDWELLGN